MMGIRLTAGAALLALAGASAHACDAGAPVIRLKVSSPLTVLQHGPATDLAIDAAGCVTSRFQAIDVRSGVQHFRLDDAEFTTLKREIQAAKLLAFDETHLKAALQAVPKSSQGLEHVTSDADIVELQLAAGVADEKSPRAKSIRWTGVEAALMNRPDLDELQSLSVVKTRLSALARDERLQVGVAQ